MFRNLDAKKCWAGIDETTGCYVVFGSTSGPSVSHEQYSGFHINTKTVLLATSLMLMCCFVDATKWFCQCRRRRGRREVEQVVSSQTRPEFWVLWIPVTVDPGKAQ